MLKKINKSAGCSPGAFIRQTKNVIVLRPKMGFNFWRHIVINIGDKMSKRKKREREREREREIVSWIKPFTSYLSVCVN